jgi:hypothetical protein
LAVNTIVVLLICAGNMPREACTQETARAVVSTRIDQVVCGAGVIAAAARTDLSQGEFVRIRCVMR